MKKGRGTAIFFVGRVAFEIYLAIGGLWKVIWVLKLDYNINTYAQEARERA